MLVKVLLLWFVWLCCIYCLTLRDVLVGLYLLLVVVDCVDFEVDSGFTFFWFDLVCFL